jgi:hypothetical protein
MADQKIERKERYPELNCADFKRLVNRFLKPYPFVRAVYLYDSIEEPHIPTLVFIVPSVPDNMTQAFSELQLYLRDSPLFCPAMEHSYQNRSCDWKWMSPVTHKKDVAIELEDFVKPDEPILLYTDIEAPDPYLFPQFHYRALQMHAAEWAKKWLVIHRIRLFPYTPIAPYHPKTRNVTTTYAILFDVSGDEEDLKRLEDTTMYYETIRDQYNDGVLYVEFMLPTFKYVYKENPSQDYQKEWLLVPKRPGRDPYHFEKGAFWLLYDPDVEFNEVPSISAGTGQILVTARAGFSYTRNLRTGFTSPHRREGA